MYSRINHYRLHKFNKLISKIRMVMLVQGLLWIIAGISLWLMPNSTAINVILMSALGIAFVGWGLSIDKQKWLSDSHMANVDFEVTTDQESEDIQFYGT